MDAIRQHSNELTFQTGTLLNEATKAATDGDISDSEKDGLKKTIALVKTEREELSKAFNTVRQKYKVVSKETYAESFFVLNLSAYSRLVEKYAQDLVDTKPTGVGFSDGISTGIKSTFAGLGDPGNVNFTIKHFVSL